MNMQTIFQIVDSLTPEQREQLQAYLEKQDTEPEIKPQGKRILGLHAHLGKAWMSDDFDDELPDEFWGFDKEL